MMQTVRMTDRYTDTQSIPVFGEMGKMDAMLPSPGASLKLGKTGQSEGLEVQTEALKKLQAASYLAPPGQLCPSPTGPVP